MRRTALFALLILAFAHPAFAIDFVRVVQSGDALPGDPAETFTSFDAPATDGTVVSFFGRGTEREGIFTNANGLAVVAERTTLFPGTTVNFAFFGGPLVENGMTLVSGLGAGGMAGIYLGDGGPLTIVADVFTRVPGARGTFAEFGGMTQGGSRTVFQGKDVAFHTGIYARTPAGVLSPVATARTPIPGGTGAFEYLDQPASDGSSVVFRGGTLATVGLYAGRGSAISVVADTATAIPDYPATFGFLEQADVDGDTVAFLGGDASFYHYGVFASSSGAVGVVADVLTPLPGCGATFTGFGSPAAGTDGVLFLGFGSNGSYGLYRSSGGTVEAVLRAGDALDGRTVLSILFQADGLAGARGALTAQFTDGTSGIYTFTLE